MNEFWLKPKLRFIRHLWNHPVFNPADNRISALNSHTSNASSINHKKKAPELSSSRRLNTNHHQVLTMLEIRPPSRLIPESGLPRQRMHLKFIHLRSVHGTKPQKSQCPPSKVDSWARKKVEPKETQGGDFCQWFQQLDLWYWERATCKARGNARSNIRNLRRIN